jgi:hypothetical protein
MKGIYFVYGLAILIVGCTTRLEVPKGKAAVTFNSETGEVKEQVLKEGQHKATIDEIVVFYTLEPSVVDFSFNFLFRDASEGQIQFSIKFAPKVDSLAHFYKQHRSEALPVVVQLGVRSEVRDLMSNFSSENLERKIVFETIKDKLNSKSELNRYIEIKEFVPGDIKVTQPIK